MYCTLSFNPSPDIKIKYILHVAAQKIPQMTGGKSPISEKSGSNY
jgi:hypothetical protein